MAETRILLRQARRFIDENNYDACLKLCTKVLRQDKNNYLVYVFIGKCLGKTELAPFAFKKAISIDPRNPLALKGLASYYENKEDAKDKFALLAVYDRLLRLKIGETKTMEIICKVSELGSVLRTKRSLSIILKLLDLHPLLEVYDAAVEQLPRLLLSGIAYEKPNIWKAIDHVKHKVWKHPERSLCRMITGSILEQNLNINALRDALMHSCLQAHIEFRKKVCKFLCANFLQNEHFFGLDMVAHKHVLTRGFAHEKYAMLLDCMVFYQNGYYLEAYLKTTPLAIIGNLEYIEGVFMMKCHSKLGRWIVVERTANEFEAQTNDNDFLMELKKYKFMGLFGQKKWKEALVASRSIPIGLIDVDLQVQIAECCIRVGKDVEYVMETLKQTDHYVRLQALSLILKNDYNGAIDLLKNAKSHPVTFFYIARSYWGLKDYSRCYHFLMKAERLDPNNVDVNLYLGMWYHFHRPIFYLARKYYERAYHGNDSDVTIIQRLSDIYLELNARLDHFSLLLSHNTFFPEQSWHLFRLGQLYLAFRQNESAIETFTRFVMENSNIAVGFICLAESYYEEELFELAIDNYKKAMSLDSGQKVFCLTRIGYIYNSMEDHNTALRTFKQVFELDPNYFLAFKGAANAWVTSALVIKQIQQYHIARDGLQVAINYLIRAISITNYVYTIFWWHLGNALMTLANLPERCNYVEINFDNNDDVLDLGTLYIKSNITKLADYCFWRAHFKAPRELQRSRGRHISMEIIEEEQNRYPFRCARHLSRRLSYSEWVQFGRQGPAPST